MSAEEASARAIFPAISGREAQKERTRLRLLVAGLGLLAEERTDISVLDITQLAGVGKGSFYNNFSDKAEYFSSVIAFASELAADIVNHIVGEAPDVAQHFGQSLRVLGNLHRAVPFISKAMIHRAGEVYSVAGPLVQLMREDISAGVTSGRFTVEDIEGAVGTIVGSSMMLGQRIHDHPSLNADAAVCTVAVDLLVMCGLARDDARRCINLSIPSEELARVIDATMWEQAELLAAVTGMEVAEFLQV